MDLLSLKLNGLFLYPVGKPVHVSGDVSVEAGINAASLATAHNAHQVVLVVLQPTHQRPSRVLLTGVHAVTGAKLPRAVNVSPFNKKKFDIKNPKIVRNLDLLVKVIAKGVGYIADSDARRSHRIRIGIGVVVLGHTPTSDFAVVTR